MINWIDLVLLVVLGLFGLRGFFRGLFREIFSLAGLIAGFMVAVNYDDQTAAYLAQFWKWSPLIIKGVAFIAVFFAVYFAFNLVGCLLHRSEKMLFMKSINRAGGIAVGLGKGVAVASLLVFAVGSSSLLSRPARDSLHSAYLVSPLSQLAQVLVQLGKDKIFTEEQPANGKGVSI